MGKHIKTTFEETSEVTADYNLYFIGYKDKVTKNSAQCNFIELTTQEFTEIKEYYIKNIKLFESAPTLGFEQIIDDFVNEEYRDKITDTIDRFNGLGVVSRFLMEFNPFYKKPYMYYYFHRLLVKIHRSIK